MSIETRDLLLDYLREGRDGGIECAVCREVGALSVLTHGAPWQLAPDDPRHTVEDVLARRAEGYMHAACVTCINKPRMDNGVCWRCVP